MGADPLCGTSRCGGAETERRIIQGMVGPTPNRAKPLLTPEARSAIFQANYLKPHLEQRRLRPHDAPGNHDGYTITYYKVDDDEYWSLHLDEYGQWSWTLLRVLTDERRAERRKAADAEWALNYRLASRTGPSVAAQLFGGVASVVVFWALMMVIAGLGALVSLVLGR